MVGGAAVELEAALGDVHDEVLLQVGELAVGGELGAAVVGGGGVGEHFDDQLGMLDGEFGAAVAFVAGDHHVGVEVGVGVGDEELHVGDEGVATRALEMFAKSTRDCKCGQRVPPPHAYHREHLARDVLMLVRLRGLPLQIGLAVQRCGFLCVSHGEAPVDLSPLWASHLQGSMRRAPAADQSNPTPSKCSRIQNSIIIRIHTISP